MLKVVREMESSLQITILRKDMKKKIKQCLGNIAYSK
jgi:hypothetical protein